jgi:hypothetical protein
MLALTDAIVANQGVRFKVYLLPTIELKDDIPPEFSNQMEDWLWL